MVNVNVPVAIFSSCTTSQWTGFKPFTKICRLYPNTYSRNAYHYSVMSGYNLDTSGLFHCSILDLDRADKHCIRCRLSFVTSKNIRGIVKMASNLSRLFLRGGNLLKNFTVTSGAQRTLSVSAIRSKEYGKFFTTYCVGMKTMFFLNILIFSVF